MRRFVLLLAGVLAAAPAFAQSQGLGGGPVTFGPMDHNEAQMEALHRASVARAKALKLGPAIAPKAGVGTGILGFPLRLRPGAKAFRGNGISYFVDLNSGTAVKDFTCGTRTYDSHRGTDFSLYPFLWRMMDAGEVEIVAAAPGTIVNKNDGEFDRQCVVSGNPPVNYVAILQADGRYAYYLHMKKNSVTTRAIGARVAAGDYLGLVGSSGRSSGPHLHFELRTADDFGGKTIDPFAGACGAAKTEWKHQPENVDTDILRIATHSVVPPRPWLGCENPNPFYSDKFAPGASVWGAVYVRDQRPDTPIVLSFIRPDGQTHVSWTTSPLDRVYSFSHWWGSITLPSTGSSGVWKVRATIEGKVFEHAFMVGSLPGSTNMTLSVTPLSRTASPTVPANFTVTVKNTGMRHAVGCAIAPDAPLAAVWNVQQIGVPITEVNRTFDIATATTKTFRLSITPKSGYQSKALEIPIRVFCDNANAPITAKGVNVVTLTF